MTFNEKYPGETLRALSWKQPFASLMLHGKVETRVWDAKYRGMVLICASKAPYPYKKVIEISGDQTERINSTLQKHYESLPLGKAIAIGRLVKSEQMGKEVPFCGVITTANKCFVKYDVNSGLWMHTYDDVQPIVPFEWSGVQGWKTVDEETKSKIILL